MKLNIIILSLILPLILASECPKDFDPLPNGGCYQILKDHRQNWFSAQTECQRKGATMMEIETRDENQIVEKYLKDKGNAH